jgi:RTA1 like protein
MAAACYMAFGRIVWYTTPPGERRFERLWVPPRWITPIFVIFDISAFLIQLMGVGAVGAAVTAEPQDQKKLSHGYSVLKFGLVIQLLCFTMFAIVGFRFFFLSRGWTVKPEPGLRRPWRQLLNAVNVCATLITVSSSSRPPPVSALIGPRS